MYVYPLDPLSPSHSVTDGGLVCTQSRVAAGVATAILSAAIIVMIYVWSGGLRYTLDSLHARVSGSNAARVSGAVNLESGPTQEKAGDSCSKRGLDVSESEEREKVLV